MKRLDLGTIVFIIVCLVGVTAAIMYFRPDTSESNKASEERRAREIGKSRGVMEGSNAVLLGASTEASGDVVECEQKYREALSCFLRADVNNNRVGELRVRLAVVISKNKDRSLEVVTLLNDAMDQFVSQGTLKLANETMAVARRICLQLNDKNALGSLEQKLTALRERK